MCSSDLNTDCHCKTLRRDDLMAALTAQLGADLCGELLSQRPHLFSETAVFVSADQLATMRQSVRAIEAAIALPVFRDAALRRAGLAQGGSLDNAVVVDGARVLNPGGLRGPDEFVRHKLLDVIGEMSARTVEGQALDVGWVRDQVYDLTPDDYRQRPIFWQREARAPDDLHDILCEVQPWLEADTHRLEFVNRVRLFRALLGDDTFDADYWATRLDRNPGRRIESASGTPA